MDTIQNPKGGNTTNAIRLAPFPKTNPMPSNDAKYPRYAGCRIIL